MYSLKSLEKVREYRRCFGAIRGFALALKTAHGRPAVEVSTRWVRSPHPVYLRAGTSDVWEFNSILVDDEYRLPLKKTPGTILDLGANIGLTTIWFATTYPGATIVSVEPDEANFELLQKNTEPFPNVRILHGAAWSAAGPLCLEDPGRGPDAYQVHESLERHAELATTVDGYTIDGIMARFGLATLDLLKIDIEGSEREVFRQAEPWIDQVDAIAIELHDRLFPGCSTTFFDAVKDFSPEQTSGMTTFVTR